MDRIRLASAADAPAIAALQAESWRATYRGFLPDANLDRDVFDDRAAAWRRRFGEPQDHPVLTLPAQRFYEALGGCAADRAFADDDSGGAVATVRYVWRRLDVLSCRRTNS